MTFVKLIRDAEVTGVQRRAGEFVPVPDDRIAALLVKHGEAEAVSDEESRALCRQHGIPAGSKRIAASPGNPSATRRGGCE